MTTKSSNFYSRQSQKTFGALLSGLMLFAVTAALQAAEAHTNASTATVTNQVALSPAGPSTNGGPSRPEPFKAPVAA